jgi:hypothetical protein
VRRLHLGILDVGLELVGDVELRLDGEEGSRVADLVGLVIRITLELLLPADTIVAVIIDAKASVPLTAGEVCARREWYQSRTKLVMRQAGEPSTPECSPLSPARPSSMTMNWNDLSKNRFLPSACQKLRSS